MIERLAPQASSAQPAPARAVRFDIGPGAVGEGHRSRRLKASRALGLAPLLERIDAGKKLTPQIECALPGLGQANQLDRAQTHGAGPSPDAIAK